MDERVGSEANARVDLARSMSFRHTASSSARSWHVAYSCLGFRGLGSEVWDSEFGFWNIGFRILDFGFGIQGLGFGVRGSGFKVWSYGV